MELAKTFVPEWSNERVSTFLVNGFYVRSMIWIDFTEGGNDAVYGGGPLSHADFIPPGEIWLDKDNGPELIFICIHELRERRAMLTDGTKYEDAHNDYANPLEQEARDNPPIALDIIKRELDFQPLIT